ncbi:hypothetical protein F511_43452 [Dorcoceras hygrometricum]|uniref:Uncharacterized protein n=1 Tax=Dorcoceras hygrometricum TaxID=472368 RepID=A0A2Z6ZYV0_9LAMI|nr:hypothetical protein F511_43452 [Dorcoceras hygrometricum]
MQADTLSLFKGFTDDTNFLIWPTRSPRIVTKSPRIVGDLPEDHGEYLARPRPPPRYAPPSSSINTRHQVEALSTFQCQTPDARRPTPDMVPGEPSSFSRCGDSSSIKVNLATSIGDLCGKHVGN